MQISLWKVFNGEIYNHLEIRRDLKYKSFKTSSDTETILWAFTELGVEKAISKFIGMFAIALFDKIENKSYLIRDRVGIKPLFKMVNLYFLVNLKALENI